MSLSLHSKTEKAPVGAFKVYSRFKRFNMCVTYVLRQIVY
jgi:hypothetical protein